MENDKADASDLRDLKRLAIEKALETKDLSDIEKAASISKTLADQEKIERDNINQPRLLRFESYKTFASTVVPLLTLLTLAFTVWIQVQQLKATSEANADAGWRDTSQKVIAQLRAAQVDSQLTLQLLRPYFRDVHHGAEAVDVAMLVVSRVGEERAADVLFASEDLNVTPALFPTFLYKMKELGAQMDSVNDPKITTQLKEDQKEKMVAVLRNNLRNICNKLSQSFLSGAVKFPERAQGLHFEDCTLENVQLGAANVGDAVIRHVELKGTDLSAVDSFENSSWEGSDWWSAKSIAPSLLEYLIRTYYPYADGTVDYPQNVPTKVDYAKAVEALCKSAAKQCQSSTLPYGVQASATIKAELIGLSSETIRSIASDDRPQGTIWVWTEGDDHPLAAQEIEKQLISSKLCDVMDRAALDEAAVANKVARAYVYGYSCGERFSELREFLLRYVFPEYSMERIRRKAAKEVESGFPAGVINVLDSLSYVGMVFMLTYEGGVTWEEAPPTASEKAAIDNLVSARVCTSDSPSSLREQELAQKKKENSIKYGLSCNDKYRATRDFVLEILIPRIVSDAHSG